ncbi:MAG TPA: hypothetical protein VK054_05815 [Beutenbergiaceae bacterium]|nr:hypothetical protein [Beutenbergiaceae bacterium]
MTNLPFLTETQRRDAQYANTLARRRQRLLRFSLPVVIVAAIVALVLLVLVGLNLVGNSSYNRANYDTAINRYRNTQTIPWVEPWKAYFNEGTAQYASGKFYTATQRLAIALDKVPKAPDGEPRDPQECMVRVNYSLALEGTGDEARAVGNPAEAEEYYTQALDMLDDCADSGAGGDTADDAQQRQEESQEEAQDQQESEPEEDPEGTGDQEEPESPDDNDPTTSPDDADPKEEELEERNRQANEDEFAQEEGGVGDGSGENW